MAVRRLSTACRQFMRRDVYTRRLCSREAPPTVTPTGVSVELEDERVQDLLTRLRGMDFDLVFASRREPLTSPEYKLMNLQQLKKAHMEAESKAKELLQMPPVLPERPPREDVLEKDPRLEGYLEANMIFTDISMNKENNDRRIVVREPSGDLRDAAWDERDRMCQVYRPVLGCTMWLPKMLTEEGLSSVLRNDLHCHVLDLVCVQCQPGSRDYIRVHHTVYEDIDRRNLYDLLRSTKHFGGLVWYLVGRGMVRGLMEDTLRRKLYSNAEDLVRLYLLCHTDSDLSQRVHGGDGGMELVRLFLEHHGLAELSTLLPVWKEEGSGPEGQLKDTL